MELSVSPRNEVLALDTTLVVPPPLAPQGTAFLWPGLQPSPGDLPVGTGVLQTVLTWGPTCAPGSPADPYASWWVSPEYVNVDGDAGPYAGCRGGEGAVVAEGDVLRVSFRRVGTTWTERVVDERSGRTTAFEIDLAGQAQRRALFVIEDRDGAEASTAVFSGTRVTFAEPEAAACQPVARGAGDGFSVPHASVDGRTCCIERITLAADGAR